MTRAQKLKFIEKTNELINGFRILDRYEMYDDDECNASQFILKALIN